MPWPGATRAWRTWRRWPSHPIRRLARSWGPRAVACLERWAVALPPRSSALPRRANGGLEPDLQAGLHEAHEHGFVIPRPDGRLELRHELIAGAIEADLLPHQRRRHHEALAEALADRPAEALPHWRAANRPEAALDAAIAAATLPAEPDSPAGGARAGRGGAAPAPAGTDGSSRSGPRLAGSDAHAPGAVCRGRPDRPDGD